MDEILAALESLEYHGSFYSDRKIPTKYLELTFSKIGTMTFPLLEGRIKEIIQIAEPAQFGWKDKTIFDESVRKVWEVKKSKFRIGKKSWDKGFKQLLENIKTDLGLPKSSVLKAEIHNMLIYEPGNFFKPHQDSEKTDNMVATMVVVLPTDHKGGELIIDHKGEKQILKRTTSAGSLDCFSFYADCFHEVKEVTAGYRVTLTFNLILENYNGSIECVYEKDFYNKLYLAFTNYFINKKHRKENKEFSREADKFIYLLDHEYTQNGLSWDKLKNSDRIRVEAITKIADELGLTAHLSLVDFKETWECEFDYDDYKSRRRNRDYDDEDNEEEGNPIYIMDSNATLSYWINRKGEKVSYKDYEVSGGNIRWTQINDAFNPYESEYEPWMGNYGNTLDRWYHRAAIILWHQDEDHSILFEMDSENFVEEIFVLMKEEGNRTKILKMLSKASQYWKRYSSNHQKKYDYERVLELSIYLNDKGISSNLLKEYDNKIINIDTVKLWCKLIAVYGADWVIEIFKIIIKPERFYSQSLIPDFGEIVRVLLQSDIDLIVISWLFEQQFEVIKKEHQLESGNPFYLQQESKNRCAEIKELFLAAIYAKNTQQHEVLIKHIKNNSHVYDPIFLVELFSLYNINLNKEHLKLFRCEEFTDYIRKLLKKEQDIGLKDSGDWSIDIKLTAEDKNLKLLYEFLKDPKAHQKVWPLVETARHRISSEIQKLCIPLKEEIDRNSRPYKLILTKTDKLHLDARERHESILSAIKHLEDIAKVLIAA